MILTFNTVTGFDVPIPGIPAIPGQPLRLITDGFVCESGSEQGARLSKLCRRDQCLAPANKETADFLGLQFIAPAKGGKGDA